MTTTTLRDKRIKSLILFVKLNRQVPYDRFADEYEKDLVMDLVGEGTLLLKESQGKKYIVVNRGRVE